MGIDICVHWEGQSEESKEAQRAAWLTSGAGKLGYLREAYHGQPYATAYLCPEALVNERAKIPARVLRDRLPATLLLAEERERKLYKSSAAEIETVKESYRGFVALCEEKEKESGEMVEIVAWC